MKSLFDGITALPKRYLEVYMARIGALIVSFAVLILLTVLFAYLMLVNWHSSELLTFSLCAAPWLIALIGLIAFAVIQHMRLERDKQELYELGRQQILVQGVTMLMAFLQRRRNKKRKKTEELEEDDE